MPEFAFDPKDHVYTLDGVVIPSVTQILTDLRFIDKEWFTTKACIRGQKVHLAAAMLESPGGLDWESLKPIEEILQEPVIPYVRGYERFLRETGWKSEIIERPAYHPSRLFAGTADRPRGFFPGSRRPEGLEIKTGIRQFWWEYQLGGYDELEGLKRWTTVRLTLGDFVLEPWKNLNAGFDFLHMAETHRCGRKHGLYGN